MRATIFFTALLLAACKKPAEEHGNPPPPPVEQGPVDCAKNAGSVNDPIAKSFFPTTLPGACIDPNTESKAYGASAGHSLDDVCTELFDGECEVYKRLGLDRVVTVRYVEPAVKSGAVNVSLSRFASADSAFAFYTKRIVGDGDPASIKSTPLPLGAAASLGSGIAYLVRGSYVAELTYLDDAVTTEGMAAASQRILQPVVTAIDGKLPGDASPPKAVALLPTAARVASGVSYVTTDTLGIRGLGQGAVGYYREGKARWRSGVVIAADEAAAKKAFDSARAWATGEPARALTGSESFALVHREDAASAPTSWVFGRAGTRIAFVGDEEHVRFAKQTPAEASALTIPEDRKRELLGRLLGGGNNADAGVPPMTKKAAP